MRQLLLLALFTAAVCNDLLIPRKCQIAVEMVDKVGGAIVDTVRTLQQPDWVGLVYLSADGRVIHSSCQKLSRLQAYVQSDDAVYRLCRHRYHNTDANGALVDEGEFIRRAVDQNRLETSPAMPLLGATIDLSNAVTAPFHLLQLSYSGPGATVFVTREKFLQAVNALKLAESPLVLFIKDKARAVPPIKYSTLAAFLNADHEHPLKAKTFELAKDPANFLDLAKLCNPVGFRPWANIPIPAMADPRVEAKLEKVLEVQGEPEQHLIFTSGTCFDAIMGDSPPFQVPSASLEPYSGVDEGEFYKRMLGNVVLAFPAGSGANWAECVSREFLEAKLIDPSSLLETGAPRVKAQYADVHVSGLSAYLHPDFIAPIDDLRAALWQIAAHESQGILMLTPTTTRWKTSYSLNAQSGVNGAAIGANHGQEGLPKRVARLFFVPTRELYADVRVKYLDQEASVNLHSYDGEILLIFKRPYGDSGEAFFKRSLVLRPKGSKMKIEASISPFRLRYALVVKTLSDDGHDVITNTIVCSGTDSERDCLILLLRLRPLNQEGNYDHPLETFVKPRPPAIEDPVVLVAKLGKLERGVRFGPIQKAPIMKHWYRKASYRKSWTATDAYLQLDRNAARFQIRLNWASTPNARRGTSLDVAHSKDDSAVSLCRDRKPEAIDGDAGCGDRAPESCVCVKLRLSSSRTTRWGRFAFPTPTDAQNFVTLIKNEVGKAENAKANRRQRQRSRDVRNFLLEQKAKLDRQRRQRLAQN
jgi:hypothetical protein